MKSGNDRMGKRECAQTGLGGAMGSECERSVDDGDVE